MGALGLALRWLRRSALLLLLLASLVLNVLTLTVGAVSDVLSAMLRSVGVDTVPERERRARLRVEAETAEMRGRVRSVTNRAARRTAQAAGANIAATFGEAIPFYGIAIVAGATTYEIATACETMTDLAEIGAAVGVADDGLEAERLRVCGLGVPTAGEIWEGIKASPGAAWDASVAAVTGLGDMLPEIALPEIPRPDFAGWWGRIVSLIPAWESISLPDWRPAWPDWIRPFASE